MYRTIVCKEKEFKNGTILRSKLISKVKLNEIKSCFKTKILEHLIEILKTIPTCLYVSYKLEIQYEYSGNENVQAQFNQLKFQMIEMLMVSNKT